MRWQQNPLIMATRSLAKMFKFLGEWIKEAK